MSTSYCLKRDESRLVIDVSTEVGESIARIFIGLLIRQGVETEFTVRRADSPEKASEVNTLE
jgi:hypothetical protein